VGTISLVLATLIILMGLVFLWRNEQQLEEQAEKALPGLLEADSAGADGRESGLFLKQFCSHFMRCDV
jgi:hypothetical protein